METFGRSMIIDCVTIIITCFLSIINYYLKDGYDSLFNRHFAMMSSKLKKSKITVVYFKINI